MSRFVNPPHAGSKQIIRRVDLKTYEQMGTWLAQRKFNGTHSVIWIHNDEIALWDRHGVPQTLYKLTPSMKECLLKLKHDKEMVVVGELLHSKAKSKITNQQVAKDTIVLFDILYYGDHLTAMNQVERLVFLSEICGKPEVMEENSPGMISRGLVVARKDESNLWLAETFMDDFLYHFDEIIEKDKHGNDRYPEIEGLMLRLKDNHLRAGQKGDVNWMVKCRKYKDKVYNF